MDLDHRAEELASDLGVDKEEVHSDLRNLLEYSVPVEEAVQSLRRKYGDGSEGGGPSGTVDIAEITVDATAVTVTGRVLTAGKRSIRIGDDDRVIVEGELADDTDTIQFTDWEDFGLSAGDTVTVANAGVREWDGAAQLNLGEHTALEFHEEPLEVPYDVGGDATLADLEPGDRAVNLEVSVLEVERRTIDGRDGETEIQSGVFGDGSGRLPFTVWDPRPEIEAGASLAVGNAHVREFRGVPEVSLSEFTTVTPLDRAVTVADEAPRMRIGEAVESGGVYDVELVGDVLSVRDGSGLVQRCPECSRVVQKGTCRSHGSVDPEDDLRVKAVLDDGTGTATVVLDRELTSAVYGGDLEDARDAAREAMDQSVVADAIGERIVGRAYRVRGHLSVDDFGATLQADTFERVSEDPGERARALLEDMGQAHGRSGAAPTTGEVDP